MWTSLDACLLSSWTEYITPSGQGDPTFRKHDPSWTAMLFRHSMSTRQRFWQYLKTTNSWSLRTDRKITCWHLELEIIIEMSCNIFLQKVRVLFLNAQDPTTSCLPHHYHTGPSHHHLCLAYFSGVLSPWDPMDTYPDLSPFHMAASSSDSPSYHE